MKLSQLTKTMELLKDEEKVTLKEVLEYPEEMMVGKVFITFGNLAGFDTVGPAYRKFVYEAKGWKVSDVDLSDGYEESYDMHFSTEQIKGHSDFSKMLFAFGYLLDNE